VEVPDIIRRRRAELGLSQAELAAQVGLDKRQIRRYEAGDAQPTLSVARAIAVALRVSLDELAGAEGQRVDLSGDWWAAWQTWKDSAEVVNVHEIRMHPRGDVLDVAATTRGTQTLDDGGYLWRGEMRVWDNEVVMGWYIATEGAVRSKGTMFFSLHQHGQRMSGRWVGLSYDGPIVTGWGAIARTEDDVTAVMNELRNHGMESA
jgi:transcriptional regulator with XRE-family HTH domain